MKVLITSDTYKPTVNGVVTSILNLKEGLEAKGAEVRVLTLSNTSESYSEEGIYYIGSRDMSRVYPGVRLRTKSGRDEVKAILEWAPDIIHTQSEFSTFHLARRIAKKLSVPIVHTYHTVYEDYTHYFSPQATLGKKAVAALTNRVADKVEAMVAPTDKVEDILNRYGVACPVSVIPTGISLDRFEAPGTEKAAAIIRRQLGFPEDHLVLVSVSRVCKEKNIEELIRFMDKLRDKAVSLVVVGDGPVKEDLEKLRDQLGLEGSVIFTGMVNPEEVPAFYKMADIFVSGSTSETQGLTYIEALASGTPILCREDEALEQVLSEGVNGYSYTDEAAFLDNLEKLSETAKTYGLSKAAAKSAQTYSRTTFADKVYGLYQSVIRKDRELSLQAENDQVEYRMMNALTFIIMVLMAAATVYGYQQGYFTNIGELQALVASVGIWGPLLFIGLQIVQVVFPIIPGGLGMLAGVILFGPLWGFVYNYIGIVAGSLIVFGISKVYGRRFVRRLFPRYLTEKYFKWVDKKGAFTKWFAAAIFFPIAPDDLLCYIAGTTKMKWREYSAIILLGKPASIALYSLGLNTVFKQLLTFA